MTTTEISPLPAPEQTCAESLAALAAQCLSGLHLIDGAIVRTTGTVTDDGWITWDVTQYGFTGPDKTARIQFHPTDPVPVVAPDSGEST